MDDAPIAPLDGAQRAISGAGGRVDEREQRRRGGASIGPMMREDVEESLFRFVEAVARVPRWQRRIRRAVHAGMRLTVLEKKRLGTDRLFREAVGLAERWGRFRGPRLARELGVDPSDPRSLGRIQDWEDELFGVTGHWTEEGTIEGRRCATKHETACPFADVAAEDTRICTELVHRLETETFRSVQPGYRLVPLERLLSRGDASCTFRHEVPVAERAKETPTSGV